MLVRNLLIGAVALSLTVPAAAEPTKPQAAETSRPESRRAEVVLASAEQVSVALPPVQDPAASAPAAVPAKKRAARVTTCRCADQTTQR